MGFSDAIRQQIFVRSARHCCVCHKAKGLNIEIHHITPASEGGEDSLENAIALCFDCHADAGHYFAGHPKGSKLSPPELKKHKEEWLKIVNEHKITDPKTAVVELSIENKDFKGFFSPLFIKETTTYLDRNAFRRINDLLGNDNDEFVKEFKEKLKMGIPSLDSHLSKINTYDELMDYFNGDHLKKIDIEPDTNPQPLIHQYGIYKMNKQINESNCILLLKLRNYGPEVLEDYKLYLNFENILEADSVNKHTSVFDNHRYQYNVLFSEATKGYFLPERNILVQNDAVALDPICFRPDPKAKFVTLNWELFARDLYTSGSLKIDLKVKFEKRINDKYVHDADKKKKSIRILPKIKYE